MTLQRVRERASGWGVQSLGGGLWWLLILLPLLLGWVLGTFEKVLRMMVSAFLEGYKRGSQL